MYNLLSLFCLKYKKGTEVPAFTTNGSSSSSVSIVYGYCLWTMDSSYVLYFLTELKNLNSKNLLGIKMKIRD